MREGTLLPLHWQSYANTTVTNRRCLDRVQSCSCCSISNNVIVLYWSETLAFDAVAHSLHLTISFSFCYVEYIFVFQYSSVMY